MESTHILKTLQVKCQTGEVWDISDEKNEVQGVQIDSHQAFKYIKCIIDDKYDIITRVAVDAYIEVPDENGDL